MNAWRNARRLWPLLTMALALPALAADNVLVRVEAESYTAVGGGTVKVIDRPEASGGKTVSYWEDPGVWLELSFDVPQAGDYRLSVGYALNWPDTRRQVLLDGKPVGEITLAGTGDWGNFVAVTTPLKLPPLKAGRHTLRLLNAASRGLSLDWVALHSPQVFVADRPLSAEEYAALQAHYRPAEPVACLQAGDVRAEFSADGQARLAQVAGALLGAELPPGDAAPVRLLTVGKLRVAVCEAGERLTAWLTEGKDLYVLCRAASAEPLRLPAPLANAERCRLVTGHLASGEALAFSGKVAPRETDELALGGLCLTATSPLRLGPWHDPECGAPAVDLPLQSTPQGWVGAARFSRRPTTPDQHPSITATGGVVHVREAIRRYPTLALFYGEATFDLTLDAAAVKLTDASTGATVSLSQAP